VSAAPAPRPSLVVATGNRGKLAEIRAILADLPVVWCSLSDFSDVEMPDEGDDYAANAAAKARTVARHTGLPALADDSGLEVDALGGRPGPRSARYGGPGLDDAGRVARLLGELAGRAEAERGARFVCIAAFATPDGVELTRRGECPGRILAEPSGDGGFGYDPVFHATGELVSMAGLSPERKNRISHRGRAIRALRDPLERVLGLG
jgi:XTP/dITP diphosphohydrolase